MSDMPATDAEMNAISDVEISVVLPSFNEAENLPTVLVELDGEIAKLERTAEIIVVDDGSTDDTAGALKEVDLAHSNLRYLRFGTNLGKSAALTAGIERCNGDVIVFMDADGQDDPTNLRNMIGSLDELDMVTGSRAGHRKDRFIKRHTSRIYNAATRKVTGIDAEDMNSGFKAMRTQVAKSILIQGELHRYLPVLAAWSGFKVGEVPVSHRQRLHGETKFGASRFWRGMLDLVTVRFLTRYDSRPFHLFGGLGIALGVLGGMLLSWMAFERFALNETIGARPALIAGVLLSIVAVQLVSFGLLGELISSQNRGPAPVLGTEEPLET